MNYAALIVGIICFVLNLIIVLPRIAKWPIFNEWDAIFFLIAMPSSLLIGIGLGNLLNKQSK